MLKVLFNSTDISPYVENFLVDDYQLVLLSSGELAVGYYKPINALYAELSVVNTSLSNISLKYFNGSAFVVTPVKDNTRGFSRSGFITWDRGLEGETTTAVGGSTMYWYKIVIDVDTSSIKFDGINLVFSDDNDLKEEYPNVMEFLPEGKTSFINFHVAARRDIISYFAVQGKLVTPTLKNPKLPTAFDLLNIDEVREASKFLVLAKLMFWLSDAEADKWYQKGKDFETKYKAKIDTAYLSLDVNDDGEEEKPEVMAIQSIKVVRR